MCLKTGKNRHDATITMTFFLVHGSLNQVERMQCPDETIVDNLQRVQ